MTREIVFDTETTGLYCTKGDRLVEIGAVELINHMPTGVTFHQYINPERDVPEDVVKVHGLTYDFLKDFPTFDKIADKWIDFVGDADLVAHNATFDMTFVNYELKQIGKTEFDNAKVIDTLEIAKNLFPGARCNLDALCKRFGVDNTSRTLHGALLDAQLLAEVYLELLGGKEPSLLLDSKKQKENKITNVVFDNKKNVRVSRNFVLSDEELKLHSDFLENKIKSAIWNS
ncbi:MAG: DNA polymerase III subunit epsilon [Alphaproteobacteria bacterium]|nr:DNA polymerase III subunit epsilon [Alphaproteobacteria bacterium]